ncbi:sensor histidine kinase [Candidatus Margulisiibacteriota bacterium]
MDKNILSKFIIIAEQIANINSIETPLEAFLNQLLSIINRAVECNSINIYLKGDKKGTIYKAAFQSPDIYSFEAIESKKLFDNNFYELSEFAGNYLKYSNSSSSFYTENKSLAINNIQNIKGKPKKTEQHNLELSEKPNSALLIPMYLDNTKSGIFELKYSQQNYFNATNTDFLEGVVQFIKIALAAFKSKGALHERVKELSCLYEISKIAQSSGLSLENIILKINEVIQKSFKYHDLASSKIMLKENPILPISTLSICKNIYHREKVIGYLEVKYPPEIIKIDKRPFLKEERSLVKEVARQIAIIIEEKTLKEENKIFEEQLRHADRLSTVGELASGVAHELNEPLGNILGFAELIKKNSALPKQITSDIDKIKEASLHAREIIKNLLIFAHQVPTNFSRVNLNKIITDGLYFFRSRCSKEGIELKKVLDPKLPDINADPSQLNQVLVNLVVNAIQAMPRGGALIIKTNRKKENLVFSVEDTGVGIKKEDVKKIFNPFFTTKEVGKGTGLGLSVVHGIIKSHRGNIKVASELNKGTSFKIILPIQNKG